MRRNLLATALAALAVATTGAGTASAATAVSSNWSGYAVTGTTFSSVSGTWVEPTASCSSSTTSVTASAFWVGLGGESDAAGALEQTGTEADCLANGTVRYSAWYELVPAASVRVSLGVSAGDTISASVRVSGSTVTVRLANATTGKTFAKTLRMAAPDTSSAEWIAEAPSTVTPGGESILPLTDFGTVRFKSARATSSTGHTGSISDSAWTATRIRLESGASSGPGPFGPFAAESSGVEAAPGALAPGGTGFSVIWKRTSAGSSPPGAL
ncbi:MAG TPA: G1 family glutamic endopeptidase [Gaiellaceae bacterium]|nr:G1 family glutamic endopeptidase [Gaiellaceae bacterium]